MPSLIDERLRALGVELPTPSAPGVNYVPTVRSGNLLFITGQLSQWNGERRFIGKLSWTAISIGLPAGFGSRGS